MTYKFEIVFRVTDWQGDKEWHISSSGHTNETRMAKSFANAIAQGIRATMAHEPEPIWLAEALDGTFDSSVQTLAAIWDMWTCDHNLEDCFTFVIDASKVCHDADDDAKLLQKRLANRCNVRFT